MTGDIWAGGDAYEAYMGRWGRRVAALFVSWLDVPARWRWLDVGCGTGALTASVLAACDPAEVTGIDSSDGSSPTLAPTSPINAPISTLVMPRRCRSPMAGSTPS